MFTGIVEEAGVIEKITPAEKSIEMTVRAERLRARLEDRRQRGGQRLLPDGGESFRARSGRS